MDKLLKGLSKDEQTYVKLLVIRRFEENLLRLFSENKLFGTTHTCIGQEAIAVGVMASIVPDDDIIFSNHRCHGHFIAYSHRPELLLKEIMGKTNSLCDGKGGSQHIHYKNFYTNGVQGGIVPNAVGVALSEKLKATNNIVIVFIGDGTLGQGVVYESMNLAQLFEIPILFVLENNGYAMSTKTSDAVSGSISERASAFGIRTQEIDGNDVKEVTIATKNAINFVRTNTKPFMLICNTYRMAAHSKGDDSRPKEEIESHRKNDPLLLAKAECVEYTERFNELDNIVNNYISAITQEAENEDFAKLTASPEKTFVEKIDTSPVPKQRRYVDYINLALEEALRNNKDTILIGEDVKDPYGGAFKVTRGLSTKFPSQVYNMPISEAAIAGISVGASLNGTRVISEIMFGDFVSLTFDQLLNHASKYMWVYGKNTPFILRTPMGAGRGYGPTHSQSVEKYIVGIPDLNIVALSALHNPVYFYRQILAQTKPTVVIENKLLYSRRLLERNEKNMIDVFYAKVIHNHLIPTYVLSLNQDFSANVTLLTYGGMVETCMEATKSLMIDYEIAVNVVVIGQLSSVPSLDLREINKHYKTNAFLFVEEGTFSYGLGAEFISRLTEFNENTGKKLGAKYSRIAMPDVPIPNSLLLEKNLLPSTNTIVMRVKEMV